MTKKYFVTGTDTGVGKTYITAGILNAFRQNKFSTLGIKPVASGGKYHNGHLVNEDALVLQEASSIKLHYHQINPFCLEPPIAPHIAAELVQQRLTVAALKQRTQYAIEFPADLCLIEGAGGWYTPLNAKETLADFVKALQLPVILVIGMRLGCINHTLLTLNALKQDGVILAGWIANCIDPEMPVLQENLAFFREYIKAPCLGIVGWGDAVVLDSLATQGIYFGLHYAENN